MEWTSYTDPSISVSASNEEVAKERGIKLISRDMRVSPGIIQIRAVEEF